MISVMRVRGEFANGTIYGVTSGANRSIINVNTDAQVGDNVFEDISDNVTIETESDAIIDWTEHNPFGDA